MNSVYVLLISIDDWRNVKVYDTEEEAKDACEDWLVEHQRPCMLTWRYENDDQVAEATMYGGLSWSADIVKFEILCREVQ